MPRGEREGPPQGPERHENLCLWRFLGPLELPQGPRGMPEAVAVDPESISPRGGMATPFSPDLMFSGPGFGCSGKQNSGPGKHQIWLESGRHGSVCCDTWLKLIGGFPRTFWTGPRAPKGPKNYQKSKKTLRECRRHFTRL